MKFILGEFLLVEILQKENLIVLLSIKAYIKNCKIILMDKFFLSDVMKRMK